MNISKEIPPRVRSGLIFKGLLSEANVEYLVDIRKQFLKPLKIRPPAINPIDIHLEKIGMIGNSGKQIITIHIIMRILLNVIN